LLLHFPAASTVVLFAHLISKSCEQHLGVVRKVLSNLLSQPTAIPGAAQAQKQTSNYQLFANTEHKHGRAHRAEQKVWQLLGSHHAIARAILKSTALSAPCFAANRCSDMQ
jgi:hypothetical protein